MGASKEAYYNWLESKGKLPIIACLYLELQRFILKCCNHIVLQHPYINADSRREG